MNANFGAIFMFSVFLHIRFTDPISSVNLIVCLMANWICFGRCSFFIFAHHEPRRKHSCSSCSLRSIIHSVICTFLYFSLHSPISEQTTNTINSRRHRQLNSRRTFKIVWTQNRALRTIEQWKWPQRECTLYAIDADSSGAALLDIDTTNWNKNAVFGQFCLITIYIERNSVDRTFVCSAHGPCGRTHLLCFCVAKINACTQSDQRARDWTEGGIE